MDSINARCGFYDCESIINQGKENDSLVFRLNNAGGLVEKYVPKKKIDESYPDTMELRYINKIVPINFSLSKERDSIAKMKLVSVRMIYNEDPESVFEAFRIQKREIAFSIAELPLKQPNDIDSIFVKFAIQVDGTKKAGKDN